MRCPSHSSSTERRALKQWQGLGTRWCRWLPKPLLEASAVRRRGSGQSAPPMQICRWNPPPWSESRHLPACKMHISYNGVQGSFPIKDTGWSENMASCKSWIKSIYEKQIISCYLYINRKRMDVGFWKTITYRWYAFICDLKTNFKRLLTFIMIGFDSEPRHCGRTVFLASTLIQDKVAFSSCFFGAYLYLECL